MKTNSLQAVICSYKGPFVTEKKKNKQTNKEETKLFPKRDRSQNRMH